MRPRFSIQWVLPWILLFSVLTPFGLSAQEPPVSQEPLVDAHGRLLIGPNGEKIRYSQEETESLERSKAAASQASPSPERSHVPVTAHAKSALSAYTDWHYVNFGSGIGDAGLTFIETEDQGSTWLVASASVEGFWKNRYWYILDERLGSFSTSWSSDLYLDEIDSLTRIYRTGFGGADQIAIGSGGRIEIWDIDFWGRASLHSSFNTAASNIDGLSFGDLGNPEGLTAVFCDGGNALYAYSLTGTLLFQSAAYGCEDVEVGDVDGDSEAEIVVGDGTSGGWVLNGQSFAVEWNRAGGFGDFIELGDVDGDGIDEIVAGFNWNDLYVFNADTQTVAWIEDVDSDLDAVTLADWDLDGQIEVLYGDGQWGYVYALNGSDGSQELMIDNPNHGVTAIAVGDWRNNGSHQLLWGSGFSSTGPDYLRLYDVGAGAVDTTSTDEFGPFYGLAYGTTPVGDIPPGDYIAYGSAETNTFDDGLYHLLYAFDLDYLEVYVSPEPTNGRSVEGIQRMAGANLDGDSQFEILLGTDRLYDAKILAYDSVTHALEWETAEFDGEAFQGIQVADVDGDGELEVVGTTERMTTGSTGCKVYIFSAADGSTEWQSGDLLSQFCEAPFLRLADVDADPALEIIVGLLGSHLRIFDGETRALELAGPDLNITALDTADRDGDGKAEIFVGDSSGSLRVINAATGSAVEVIGNFTDDIQGLDVKDIDGDGVFDYAFTSGGVVRIQSGADSSLLWTSPNNGTDSSSAMAAKDSLVVDNLDDDPFIEVWVSLGVHGMKIYQLDVAFNQAPSVSIAQPIDGAIVEGPQVDLIGSASDPEDGDLSSAITWTSDIDGVVGTGQSLTATLSEGIHTLFATASDAGGLTGSASIQLEVTINQPPTVTILAPADGTVIEGGIANFQGDANDAEDGNLSEFIQWTSDLDGYIGSSNTVTVALSEGTHQITASISASGGTASETITVHVVIPDFPAADAHWPFDETSGTSAADASGNGFDGTVQSGGLWIDGLIDGAIELDGADDHVQVPAGPALNEMSAVTISAWIRHPTSGSFRSIVDKRDSGADGFDLYLEPGSRLFMRINNQTMTGSTVVADGDWHHVVGVWDGDGAFLWVDGVLDASATILSSGLSTTADLFIGRNFNSGSLFDGAIDDVRVFAQALEEADIQGLFDVPAPVRTAPAPSGVLAAGTTSTPLGLNTNEPADCRYDVVPATDFDLMPFAFTSGDGITHQADVTGLADGTAYTYYVRCADLSGNANQQDWPISFLVSDPQDLGAGLIGHWTLDDGSGSSAADSSANGHVGTVLGATWTTETVGSSLSFDGIDDAVRIASTTVLGSLTEVSISAWIQVQPGDAGQWMSIVDKRDGNLDGYDLFLTNGSRLFMRVNDQSHTGTTDLADGAWHHVVGTYDGSQIALWVDGALETTKSVTAETLSTSADLRIGEHWATSQFFFHGLIDEVRVYELALEASKVQALAAQ